MGAGRGAQLKLTEGEVAFYDALELEVDDSAVKVLGDEAILAPERDSSLRSE
jgi:hypothetical protein